ncbi:MAG: hypothetical protein ABFR50_09710 [Candidatus Fermentibacteria bacterium]
MKALLIISLLLAASVSVSGTFSFASPYNLQSGGIPIDVGYYAAPCVVDWDGDTLKDLITGQFSGGYIRFYKNEGTNEAPVFNSFSYLQADGSIISMGYG